MMRRAGALLSLMLTLAACGDGDCTPPASPGPTPIATATADPLPSASPTALPEPSETPPLTSTPTALPSATLTPPLTATGTPAPTATTPLDEVRFAVFDDRLELATGLAAAEIHRDPYRLRLRTASGAILATEQTGGLRFACGDGECALTAVRGWALDESDSHAPVLRLEVATDACQHRPTACADLETAVVTLAWRGPRSLAVQLVPPERAAGAYFAERFALQDGERIYGLTERPTDSPPLIPFPGFQPIDEIRPREVGTLDRRGEIVEMLVRSTIAVYAPFCQSSRGYGLLVEGSMPGTFDIGHTDPAVLRVQFDRGATDAHRTLRYVLFAGPRHADILDAYTALTGRPFVPPAWAFRHWRWRDEHHLGPPVELDGVMMNAELADDLLMYERLGIPAGVYMIDRPWSTGSFGFNAFAWDPMRFFDIDGTLAVLRARGYKVALWSAALAAGDGPGDNGTEARALGYLAPGNAERSQPDAQVIDITNPAARSWWLEKHVDFLRRYDIAAIKLDRGEEYVSWDPEEFFFDGSSGREGHNAFPERNLTLYHDILQAAHGAGNFVVMARAAYTGAQRSGIVWGGDIPGSTNFGNGPGTDLGLRTAILALQRVAFLGYPFWGSDTGGYYQFKQREVFARWLAFSAFCPLMEIGGTGAHAPWDMPTEPRYDEEMIAIYRRYTRLHHALIPYVMLQAEQAAATGLPIARPLVFEFPDDPEVGDLWDEYLYGDDVLVAPVWRDGARSREVYLPAGQWEDYWDRSRSFTGPARITVAAPLDVIPVFVRAGAVVPTPEPCC